MSEKTEEVSSFHCSFSEMYCKPRLKVVHCAIWALVSMAYHVIVRFDGCLKSVVKLKLDN